MSDQLEGRNPVYECLARNRRRVHRIFLDQGAREEHRVAEILALAKQRGVEVLRVHRKELDRMTRGRVHNGIVAQVDGLSSWTTAQLLDELADRGEYPFLLLASELSYEHNLGAILRSALGFGAHGLILPTRRGASLSSVAQRVAMGAAEEIPVIREGLNSAIKHIRKAGIRIIGAAMDGEPMHSVDLRGPVAILLGSEGSGISSNLIQRCDAIVSIPLSGELESLNVSVAAAVLMYEKQRQEMS